MLSTESHSAEELQRDANILAGLGVDVCESLGPLPALLPLEEPSAAQRRSNPRYGDREVLESVLRPRSTLPLHKRAFQRVFAYYIITNGGAEKGSSGSQTRS